ncbi:MAG: metallopeptidase family protein [Myxococcaceae bacterium]|nr:metallopeptidase family protein [Myxococcaceae bacterium]MCI0672467.1 metallopeptidase family protein [Myxococcaceae bacterium]
MVRRSRLPAVLLLAFTACSRGGGSTQEQRADPPAAPRSTASPALPAEPVAPSAAAAVPPAGATAPSVPEPLPLCHAGAEGPLDAARTHFDAGRFLPALACASQAVALTPDNADAHAERAAALAALQRLEEAQLAYVRLFALHPDHADGLLGAAHLYAVLLPGTREHDEVAALYAERGLNVAGKDAELRGRFAVLSAMAHNDLGQPATALARAEAALAVFPRDIEALHERALSRFELCRFDGAVHDFTALLDDPVSGPSAHHHLALLLEREGRVEEAERHFARAHALAPDDFPAPVVMTREEFREAVARAVGELPEDMRRDLTGIPVTAEELPATQDLLGGEPPLSPVILGLFRGPPLGQACAPDEPAPCRSVALYRKNLLRATRSREELLVQVRVTLLHEVGHLRGEDDGELAARGLE